MQVGTTKDQGLYNKPSAAVHPGALAAGTLPQYNILPAAKGVKVQASNVCNLRLQIQNAVFYIDTVVIHVDTKISKKVTSSIFNARQRIITVKTSNIFFLPSEIILLYKLL